MNNLTFYVYHISDSPDVEDGYIGVTKNPKRRWCEHIKSKYTIGVYIRKHSWTYENNFTIIFTGTYKECYDMELKLRPISMLGLNESSGGSGGDTYTGLSIERKLLRNKAISKSHTGRIRTLEHSLNISLAKKSCGNLIGSKNINAKMWKLICPKGTETIIHGMLQQYCDEHNLLITCLRYYINDTVPDIVKNTMGGYRKKSEHSFMLRQNTTGWKLMLCDEGEIYFTY